MGCFNVEASWEQAFADARAYVQRHEQIRMTQTGMSVPRDVRDEFYGKVASVQQALAASALGDFADSVVRRASLCATVRDAIVRDSDLVEFRLPRAIENAISDPAGALAAPAFGFVLDALREGGEENLFEEAKGAIS